MTPSSEQAAGIDLLCRSKQRVSVVTGPAGSGKSQMMMWLEEALAKIDTPIVGLAPTGAASKVANQRTGIRFNTIHSGLYGQVKKIGGRLSFGEPHDICNPGEIVLIDEGYMVGTKLARDVITWLPKESRLICFGDANQLPPVNDEPGFNFKQPTVKLTRVFRQGQGSPILDLAHHYLGEAFSGWHPPHTSKIDKATIDHVVDWYVQKKQETGEWPMLLAPSNAVRQLANAAIRKYYGFDPSRPQAGELLMCLHNKHDLGIMNGEFLNIRQIDYDITPVNHIAEADLGDTNVFINYAAPGNREIYEAQNKLKSMEGCLLLWDYAYCVTVHKAQGSQAKHVGLIWDSRDSSLYASRVVLARQLKYTAITRASESFTVFLTSIN